MTFAGFWCLLMGGGKYTIEHGPLVSAPTDEEWAADPRSQDGRPKPTSYFANYQATCTRCSQPILGVHL